MKTYQNILQHKYFLAIAVFSVSFLTYLATLAPTISWGDSPEFITVAYTLGIAHPSGYPLYTLLGKVFTFLPIGSIAYRINLMSAVVASLTVLVVYFIVLKITKNTSSGILSSLILAFSFVFWAHAVRAEVYTLNALFLALIILLLLRYDETKKTHLLYVIAFVYGLSFTNHLITIILALPMFFFLITKNNLKLNKKIINLKVIAIMLLLFIIGLLPYLYLPLRSLQNPAIDWGNPETLDNFIKHVSGNQYRNHLFEVSGIKLLENFFEAVYFLVLQFTIFIGFSMIGIWKLWKTNKRVLTVVCAIIFLNFLVALNYNIEDIIVYYIPSYLAMSIFIGIGLQEVIDIFLSRHKLLFIITIPVMMLFISLLFYHERIYLHKDYGAYRYAEYIFRVLPKNSIILTKSDDELFPLWYMQMVKQKRDDIVIISTSMLPSFWYIDMLKRQYPHITLQNYSDIMNQLLKMPEFPYKDIRNISYTTNLFREYTKTQIVNTNKEKYRIFNISVANISTIKTYNTSIIKEI